MIIGICDDEEIIRDEFLEFGRRYKEKSNLNFEMITFSSGEELLSSNETIDILFLDVQMKQIDGLETAMKIREYDNDMMIIFVTGYSSYMQEGYYVKAFRYLLKPFREEDFIKVLTAAIKEMTKYSKVALNKDGKEVFIKIHNIIYIEYGNRSTLVRTKNGSFQSVLTMSQWEKLLNTGDFYRVAKAYIVNMEYVEEIGRNITLENGERVELAIAKASKFKQACKEYRRRNAR